MGKRFNNLLDYFSNVPWNKWLTKTGCHFDGQERHIVHTQLLQGVCDDSCMFSNSWCRRPKRMRVVDRKQVINKAWPNT